jgi:hypothetical protein
MKNIYFILIESSKMNKVLLSAAISITLTQLLPMTSDLNQFFLQIDM